MAASKSGFMKDALILFAITLISGVCLGFVYDITKAPIERATIEANNRTYKEVLSTAAEFSEVEGSAEKIAALTESGELEGLGYGSVAIESVLEGKDESGAVTGHVINSLSNKDVYKRQSHQSAVRRVPGGSGTSCDPASPGADGHS